MGGGGRPNQIFLPSQPRPATMFLTSSNDDNRQRHRHNNNKYHATRGGFNPGGQPNSNNETNKRASAKSIEKSLRLLACGRRSSNGDYLALVDPVVDPGGKPLVSLGVGIKILSARPPGEKGGRLLIALIAQEE